MTNPFKPDIALIDHELLATVYGGGAASVACHAANAFFGPTKIVAREGGRLAATLGGRGEVVAAARVVDRPKQIARIAGTGAAVAGVTAGAVALAPGHGADDQMPSIEQLTGLE